MSNTAFALSPISARATSPTEADFEAIREAFVETARGRWFLEEYTKRNRNADTALVLDAVARIERTLAAQKELKAEEPPAPPAPDLTETLTAIKAIVAAARNSAETALSGPPMDEALAPARKCARVIREIAWGLRESGADGRICSLLDSQVEAINTACDQIPTSDFRDKVLEAFDLAAVQIDQLNATGETEAESQRETSAAVEQPPSAAHDALSNIVAFSSAATGTSPTAEASPANAPLADVEAETRAAFDTQALEQASAPIEVMETVTPTPSQPAMAAEVERQEHIAPEPQATETEVTASSLEVSEPTSFEAAASEEVTSEATTSETGHGIALDESLFDLTAESIVPASNEAEGGLEVQGSASADMMEPSAAIEPPTDVAIETAAAAEAIEQTPPVPAPESAASEPEQTQHLSISPVVATDEVVIVPQVVESLEAMADITIEEAASDEALADQTATSQTDTVVAQDHLPSDDEPQIAEQSAEPVVTDDVSEIAVSDSEQSATFDVVSATPSEGAPSMAPADEPSTLTKTPLPDIMIDGAVAADAHATASMEMPVAVEIAPVSAASHMMSLTADRTSDAITPPISLGASLIASGIVAKPETPRSDPLAAIRRMTHAERIAFFS